MKKISILVLLFCVWGLPAWAQNKQSNAFADFWQKFKTVVRQGDKKAVADLVKYPLEMPYGYKSVKTKAQLIKRYKEVFATQANAVQCFATAKPEKDVAFPKDYVVDCGSGAVYRFTKTSAGWKLAGLDNINE